MKLVSDSLLFICLNTAFSDRFFREVCAWLWADGERPKDDERLLDLIEADAKSLSARLSEKKARHREAQAKHKHKCASDSGDTNDKNDTNDIGDSDDAGDDPHQATPHHTTPHQAEIKSKQDFNTVPYPSPLSRKAQEAARAASGTARDKFVNVYALPPDEIFSGKYDVLTLYSSACGDGFWSYVLRELGEGGEVAMLEELSAFVSEVKKEKAPRNLAAAMTARLKKLLKSRKERKA